MSTEATTETSTDSAPATEQPAASTPATGSRAERRARAVAAIESKPTPSAPAPAVKVAEGLTETPEADETPAQTESREERIAKRLEAQRKAREEKQAAQQKRELDNAILSRAQNDQASVERRIREELRSQYRRDPIAFHKEHGEGGVEDALQRLTKEMLAQGHGRVQTDQELSKSELKQLREQFEAYQQQQQEREAVSAAEQRRAAFVSSTADAKKWPLLSRLDPQDRLDEGVDAWTRLAAEGHEYDADLVADLAEARLERRKKAYAEQAAPQTQATQPQAAVPKRAKTITPALASDRGAAAPLSRAERKARIVAELERADAARSARSTTQ